MMGCSVPKKLQRKYGLSEVCRESYEFFLQRMVKEGDLLEITEPALETYKELLTEYVNNGVCWSVALPEDGVIALLGVPHKRSVNPVSGIVELTYYIRTISCMELSASSVINNQCGSFIFTFFKEGEPQGCIFYALGAANRQND
jgi:hypothetical protein